MNVVILRPLPVIALGIVAILMVHLIVLVLMDFMEGLEDLALVRIFVLLLSDSPVEEFIQSPIYWMG